ncbi:MAG TPA: alpha/beta fold hydrolase, partial [Stellaceae bacterium]|nr:alpha/beta fold hydrolase [Stellaceae bacterium]
MDGQAAPPGDLGTVEDRFFTIRDFALHDGATLPEATIAYETYGRLARDGRNAVLFTHGFTGSHHAAGRNPANAGQPGAWEGLIGPGKAIDTDRLFVVASNMLGSSFGSTNAASRNPATGNAYGPDFPAIAIRDIVAAQKALLDALGVTHLVAVVGPSYGGYQGFQWAVAYPGFMDAIVAVNTAPWASVNTDKQLAEVAARLAADPGWLGGRYHGRGPGPRTALTEIRVETLKRYGIEDNLKPRFPDPAEREAAIRKTAAEWAAKWDAHSLIILRRALLGFDTRPDFARIAARVLYILCRSDALFPPKIAPGVMAALAEAGVAARYFEIDS